MGRRAKSNLSPGAHLWEVAPSRLVYLATLLNPVDHRPYMVAWDPEDQESVVVTPTQGEITEGWGQGELSSDDYPASETDCPRTHTPHGVSKKGSGLGLMLYSSLALSAALGNALTRREASKIGLPHMSACVSSSDEGPGRTSEAAKWWKSQVRKGLAHRHEVETECEERETDVQIDVDDAGIDSDYIERSEDVSGGSVSGVRGDLSGTVYYEFCPMPVDAQVLAAQSVFNAGLVIDYSPKLEALAQEVPMRGRGPAPRDALIPPEIFCEIKLDLIHDKAILEWFLEELRDRGATQEQMEHFMRANDLADQLRIPGVESFGKPTLYPHVQRNPQHTAAWKKYFGRLAQES